MLLSKRKSQMLAMLLGAMMMASAGQIMLWMAPPALAVALSMIRPAKPLASPVGHHCLAPSSTPLPSSALHHFCGQLPLLLPAAWIPLVFSSSKLLSARKPLRLLLWLAFGQWQAGPVAYVGSLSLSAKPPSSPPCHLAGC